MCLSPNCLMNLKSIRKLEIFSFLHCNKSLLYTVPGLYSALIIRLRPDVQQAVAARDAAIAASIASCPAPVKRPPVGRPKVLAPLGVQAPQGERHI